MPAWLSNLLPIALLLGAVALVLARLPKVELGHSEAFKKRRFWNWFPLGGYGKLSNLILPALTLGLAGGGWYSRMMRSSMIEVLGEDYIRVSRAKGLSERLVLWRHGFRNALIPVVTMVGLIFGGMLAGAVVTETVFSRPGLGRLVVSAILSKDYPLVQGCVLFLAILYLLVNLCVDIVYAWLDPRIRYGS